MAKNRRKRLRPLILQEDLNAYNGLLGIVGYNPSNPAFTVDKITTSKTVKETRQTAKVQADAAAAAADDAEIEGEWDFHDMILGAKTQVKAQFGEDSDEYAAMGMKKKSDYKRGKARGATEKKP